MAAVKEGEHIGRAVVVNVLDGSFLLVRDGVEALDEIDTVVEIAIGLSNGECAAGIVLMHVRSAIEVGIDGDFGEASLTIVCAPHIWPL